MRAVTRIWPLVLATVACACMSSGRKVDNPADGSKEGGVVDSAVATGPTASGWPEADLLFHKDAHWVGADDAYSVDLGGGRVLWLFADTFISANATGTRTGATMVHNTLALEDGYDRWRWEVIV
jgi:hypothetical protein